MNSFTFSLLMGGPDAAAAGGTGSFISTIIPFVLIIGIFYFLIIRPQNKKQKETQRMLDTLKKGDKVVTIGGVHGVIQTIKEKSVVLKVDDYTKIEFSRSAISSVETVAKEKEEKQEEKKDDKKLEAPVKTNEASEDKK